MLERGLEDASEFVTKNSEAFSLCTSLPDPPVAFIVDILMTN